MKWKTTVILLLLTVGVGAYVALYDLKQPTVERQQALAKQALSVPADEVTGLQITIPAGQVMVERRVMEWRMISPLNTRAEAPLIRRILQGLDPLEAERELRGSADQPLALAAYGLEPPRAVLAVTRGETTTTLEFGDRTPVGDQRYLKLAGASSVWVVPSRLFETLSQPLEAYRSHELLTLDPWRAAGVRVEIAGQPAYVLQQRSGSGTAAWTLIEPAANTPEPSAVSAVLSALRNLKIQRFVTDAPEVEQVAVWGLDQPLAHVVVETAGTQLEVFIGSTLAESADQRYAKRVDEPTLYTVSARAVDALPELLSALTVPPPPADAAPAAPATP